MIYIQIISAFLFLISIGSIKIHRSKNADAMIENRAGGKLLFTALYLVAFVIIVDLISDIVNIKWFWSFLIAILFELFLSKLLALFYSSLLGYKSKPHLSLSTLDYVRSNLHIIDALITFGLGFILYLISN